MAIGSPLTASILAAPRASMPTQISSQAQSLSPSCRARRDRTWRRWSGARPSRPTGLEAGQPQLDALSIGPVRDLLPHRARALLGVDVPARLVEAVHPGGQLRVLC